MLNTMKKNQNLSKYKVFEGDIIIAMTGGTIGKLAIVQENLGKLYLIKELGNLKLLIMKNLFKNMFIGLQRGVEERIKKLAWGWCSTKCEQ